MFDGDLTMTEVLRDPLIRLVLRADGISLGEFAMLLETAAIALHQGCCVASLMNDVVLADFVAGGSSMIVARHQHGPSTARSHGKS